MGLNPSLVRIDDVFAVVLHWKMELDGISTENMSTGAGPAPEKPEEAQAAEKGSLSPWFMPPPMDSMLDFWDRFYPLKLFNTLTRKKERFVPKSGKRVLWYICGPTVYDASHMGHARTYIQFDVLRRIMVDVFGYDVVLCMNITDIDDKIIIRAAEAKIDFRELAAKNEADFMDDMKMLGVLPPHALTRVSEYIPEVIAYIQRIIDKGYAYESNGSVYFAVKAFNGHCGHVYGKLLPEQIGNSDLLAEGEGALSLGAKDKRDDADFALWKKQQPAKDGRPPEPAWDSPWGQGRPGWHIECSAMASDAFRELSGGTMDVHSGGIDLRFPHHENEIAQAEANLGTHQWVNYWLHAGHLHIKGFKMSKSLKNFITIKQALETHTPRQIRFCFLLHKYSSPMDYGDATMSQALAVEKIFSEFFHNVKARIRSLGVDHKQHYGPREKVVFLKLQSAKEEVRAHLADDFNIPEALKSLQELVRETNKYMDTSDDEGGSTILIRSVAEFITSIFRTFGLLGADDIGFAAEGGTVSREQILSPVLDAVSQFRERMRQAAKAGDAKAILGMCDEFRDDVLPHLGVRLEDKETGSIWKLEDPEVLKKEREQKEAELLRKAEAKAEAAKRAAEKEAKARIPPSEMFRGLLGEEGKALYSQFDQDGVPTHDGAGEPLPKGTLKKLKKEWDAQKKLHDKFLDKSAAGGATAAPLAANGAGDSN